MACAICETRRPRRFCPGVRGEICTICCGTEREVSVSCPLDCPHLADARRHERVEAADPGSFPNQDIRVSEEFLEKNEPLVLAMAAGLLQSALETAGAVDSDVREGLDALVRTYRTLESGIYYETRPQNPLAAAVAAGIQGAAAGYREKEREQLGMARTRDADVLGVLAFLQRMELDRNNGRPRGRAFLDSLREFFPAGPGETEASSSSLIIP